MVMIPPFKRDHCFQLQFYRGFWIREAHVGQFLWKQVLSDEYSSSTVLFGISSAIFRSNPSQCTTISVTADFRPLFLFADVVFPRFMYANITLETVALDTPNNVAVFVTDAPAKRTPTICPLSNRTNLPFSDFFTWTVSQHNN
jgi:hypothetical protein